jgi:hypothetical protein
VPHLDLGADEPVGTIVSTGESEVFQKFFNLCGIELLEVGSAHPSLRHCPSPESRRSGSFPQKICPMNKYFLDTSITREYKSALTHLRKW